MTAHHKRSKTPKKFDLKSAIAYEQNILKEVAVPITTLSGTFKKELADKFDIVPHLEGDVLYSRAHYSMAEAVRQQALSEDLTTHLVDPMNYVNAEGWKKVTFTQMVGRAMARHKILRWLKDQVDTIARSSLPIHDAIIPPLLYLHHYVKTPIISMHYETGNILAANRFSVLQYITDPHVRPQYLDSFPDVGVPAEAHFKGEVTLAVFDQATKDEVFVVAKSLGKRVEDKQVVVVGPPVDPRIIQIGKQKKLPKRGEPINIAITTGGVGPNFNEIKTILHRLYPLLKPPEKIRLFLYTAVHKDFRNMFEQFAESHSIRIGNLDDETARIRILHEDSIIDANENLIKYMFPWTHGVITKPSGDMAYDAAAAGCFSLFLNPLGPWEENIRKIFTKEKIGFDLHVDTALSHFRSLHSHNLLFEAMRKTQNLDPLYASGVKNTIKLHQKLSQAK